MKLLRIVGQLVLLALVIAVSIFTLSELNFGFAESRVPDALVNKPSRTILIRRTANGDFLDIYKLHEFVAFDDRGAVCFKAEDKSICLRSPDIEIIYFNATPQPGDGWDSWDEFHKDR